MPLAPGTIYYYGIVAVEQGIDAPMSPFAYATTLPLPSPPSDVVAAPTPTTIALNWQENLQRGGLPVSSYQIFEGTTSGKLAKLASATATTYTATSLSANTIYYFEIVAVDNKNNDSAPSDILQFFSHDFFDFRRRLEAMFGQVKPDIFADRQRIQQRAGLKRSEENT